MHVHANGTRLWFDVEGTALVPGASEMRRRPTIVLVHGGPGSYDHSYFKPHFGRLAEHAQVVYLDLRGHGRSDWGDPADWSFEVCADDIAAFCDALGLERPFVLGHSLGGAIALLYGVRHPAHAAGLVVVGGLARFELGRLVAGFRRVAGDEVAALADRAYRGEDVTDEEWARVFAAFGPRVPDEDELARRRQNKGLNAPGMELLRRLDIVDRLGALEVPTLVCVGELDPVTPVEAAEEIAEAIPPGLVTLDILSGAGHFPWHDDARRCWAAIADFISSSAAVNPPRERPARAPERP